MWPRIAMMTLGLLVLMCGTALAPSGPVEGGVKDASGSAIAHAHAILHSRCRRYEAVSDAGGTFTLADVDEGVYGLQVRAPGVAPIANRQVTVAPGRHSAQDFRVRKPILPG